MSSQGTPQRVPLMVIVILKTTTIGIPLSVRLITTIGKERGSYSRLFWWLFSVFVKDGSGRDPDARWLLCRRDVGAQDACH
ncbi:hypothetical protein CHARACLAT_012619 [Characodon lateralis]|uniref:Uncharacterized protein n=1 Tax=Characodon lateralis TaxID=208331 RepID=A0ABU7E255_9TELE|nr:hypothetical protein [Characodon lateralis]